MSQQSRPLPLPGLPAWWPELVRAGSLLAGLSTAARLGGWRELVPFAWLGLLDVLLCWWILVPGRVLAAFDVLGLLPPWRGSPGFPDVPHNRLLSDTVLETFPARQFAMDQFAAGQWPLWNPHLLGGHPLFADPNATLLAPFTLLAAWLHVSAVDSLNWGAPFHLALAGIGIYAYLRVIGLGRLAATFGATAYMLNGVFVVWLAFPSLYSTGVWIGFVFLGYELALRRHAGWALLAGSALGCAVLGGFVQWWLYLGYAFGLYVLAHAGRAAWERNWPRLRVALIAAALTGAIGLLLGAGQLLPTLELATTSHREASLSWEALLRTRLPLDQLPRALIPDLFGTPLGGYGGTYWGAHNYTETTFYVGLLPLLLLATAVRWRRNFYAAYFGSLGALTLLLLLGTPLLHLVTELPGFQRLQLARLVYLLPFVTAGLGAIGVQVLLDPRTVEWRRRTTRRLFVGLRVAFAIGIGAWFAAWPHNERYVDASGSPLLVFLAGLLAGGTAIWFALRGSHPRLAGTALIAVLAADLLWFGARYNTVEATAHIFPRTPAHRLIEQVGSPSGRVLPLTLPFSDQEALGVNVAGVYGWSEPGGYSSLIWGRYYRLARLFDPDTARRNPQLVTFARFPATLADLTAVDTVISAQPVTGDPSLVPAGYAAGLYVYHHADALPRARIVHQVTWVADEEAAFARLAAPDFDARRETVIETTSAGGRAEGGADEPARITRDEPNQVEIAVAPSQPGYLLLADNAYPGWVARVDGSELPISVANGAFRAVAVEAGPHVVTFSFEPRSVVAGLAISISTAAALVVALLGLAAAALRRRVVAGRSAGAALAPAERVVAAAGSD